MELVHEPWEDERIDKSLVEYVVELMGRLSETPQIVGANLEEVQKVAKRYYDKTREQASSTSENEWLSTVWAIHKLQCTLEGTKFTAETDHFPLSWLKEMPGKGRRLLKWSLILQEFNFKVKSKKGNENKNADGLSRGV